MGAPAIGFFKVLGAIIFAKGAVGALIRIVLVNVIMGALQRSRNKRPPQNVPPVNVTVRNPIEERRIIFGRLRVGGAITFFGSTGDNKKYLHYIVTLAGHQVNAIQDIWIDKVQIPSAAIDGATGRVTSGQFTDKVYIWKFLGGSLQDYDPTMVIGAFTPTWTIAHDGKGVAYIHIRMERDDTAFPSGAPSDVTALVEGALLYDPRLDSTNGGSGSHRRSDPSTWAFSRNPALAARWYLTGGSVTNDSGTRLIRYGFKDPDSRLPDLFTMAAANVCDTQMTGAYTTPDGDQNLFTCDLEVSTGEQRKEILDQILATMAGRAPYVHGQWRIYAANYDTPTHSLTQNDLFTLEEAPIEIQDTNDQQDRFNSVSAMFRDDSNSYVQQSCPFRTNASYQTQDGGQLLPKEIVLRGTTNNYRAQRLAEIELRKSRQMRIIKIRGGLDLLKVAQWETFQLSHTTFAWTNRVFRCIERQLEFQEEAGRVAITAQTESSSVYDYLLTADYITPNTVSVVRDVEVPEPPSLPETVPQQNAILFRWTRSPTQNVTYDVEASTSSSMSSPSTVYDGTDNQAYLAQTSTTTYYFRVRSRKAGQVSAWVPSSGGISGAALGTSATLSAYATPTIASSTGSGASQTTNSVTVNPSGGTPGYSYLWTWQAGGSGITITSSTSASTTFSATGLTEPSTRTGTARCTITDAALNTFTVDVSVTITRTTNFSATATVASPAAKTANATTIVSSVFTATPVNGTAPYTYLWSIVSEDDPSSTPTINTPTSATTTVTTSEPPSNGLTITVVLRCQITDNNGIVAQSNNVTIVHTHDNGA